MKTETICGYSITLEAGKRYIAARPMAQDGMNWFPVKITTVEGATGEPLLVLGEMNYDEANAFLTTFNNGASSFQGRVW